MQIVLLNPTRDSNYVDLVEFCACRGIELVEEKFTSTNSDYATALWDNFMRSVAYSGLSANEIDSHYRAYLKRLHSSTNVA